MRIERMTFCLQNRRTTDCAKKARVDLLGFEPRFPDHLIVLEQIKV